MTKTFDSLDERRLRERPSLKWQWYPEDVIPCWVADMDFAPAAAITDELKRYASLGDLGYPPNDGLPGLREAVVERLAGLYSLTIRPDDLQMLPGIIPGLYLACRTLAGPDEEIVVQPPTYPPFMNAVRDSARRFVWNPLLQDDDGWRLDVEGLEAAVTPATRLLMLCNPHNPTGRVFSRDELEELARVVLRHRLWVVADELHADLTLEGRHIPFASLSKEIAQRTVTLYGPTKAFNIAGLKIGFAFSHNERLMEAMRQAAKGLVVPGNAMAQAATLAAYRSGAQWLEEALEYLRGNRDFVLDFVRERLPQARLQPTEGTYLAWLDLRQYDLEPSAAEYLLERGRVGLSAGSIFGPEDMDLRGFVRLNFATSRRILESALTRMAAAVADAGKPLGMEHTR